MAVSAVFILLLIMFLNPLGFWMPTAMVMTIVFGLVMVFGIFCIFLWRESAGDERETSHRMLAGRIAFLAGSGVLVLGITVQELRHDLDAWLVYALGVMVLAKVIARIYAAVRQ